MLIVFYQKKDVLLIFLPQKPRLFGEKYKFQHDIFTNNSMEL